MLDNKDWLRDIQIHTTPEIKHISEIKLIGGIDTAYTKKLAISVCTVFEYSKLRYVGKTVAYTPVKSDYIPSYFYLREGKIIEKNIRRCMRKYSPEVILIDGSGILHPRKAGIATQVGIKLNISTIGITKRKLVGTVLKRNNDIANIIYNDQIMGYAIWKNSQNPIYVSIGNKINDSTMIKIVRHLQKYKIPEPLRIAHIIANKIKIYVKDDVC